MASPSPFMVERLRRTARIAWSTTIWVEVALPPFSTFDLSPPPSSENEWISQLSYHGICCSYQLPQMSSEILWHISFPHRSHLNPPLLSHPFNQNIPGSQVASSQLQLHWYNSYTTFFHSYIFRSHIHTECISYWGHLFPFLNCRDSNQEHFGMFLWPTFSLLGEEAYR